MDTATRIDILRRSGFSPQTVAAIVGVDYAEVQEFAANPGDVPESSGGASQFQGIWSPGTDYKTGEQVQWNDGLYERVTPGITGEPGVDEDKWTLIIQGGGGTWAWLSGEWSDEASYTSGEMVTYVGGLYFANAEMAAPSPEPGTPEADGLWMVMAPPSGPAAKTYSLFATSATSGGGPAAPYGGNQLTQRFKLDWTLEEDSLCEVWAVFTHSNPPTSHTTVIALDGAATGSGGLFQAGTNSSSPLRIAWNGEQWTAEPSPSYGVPRTLKLPAGAHSLEAAISGNPTLAVVGERGLIVRAVAL